MGRRLTQQHGEKAFVDLLRFLKSHRDELIETVGQEEDIEVQMFSSYTDLEEGTKKILVEGLMLQIAKRSQGWR